MENIYPRTRAGEPIKYYPFTVPPRPNYYGERCAGCGKLPTRVDSYYNFMLCPDCEADDVGQAIAYHVMYPNA